MFTPTKLLKEYVQEAFAHEGIPSSDKNITTWENHRRVLARSEFNVLRRSDGKGVFVLKEITSLLPEAIENPCSWFMDFYEWQQNHFLTGLRDAARSLHTSKIKPFQRLAGRLDSILARTRGGELSSILKALATETPNIQNLIARMKKETDEEIDGTLHLQLNRDRGFLRDLAEHMKSVDTSDDDDEVGADEEDDDTVSTGTASPLIAARDSYRRAVRAQARAAASGRAVRGKSRKVADWIGERTLSGEDRIRVGQNLRAQTAARRFSNPAKRYLDRMASRYSAFRQLRERDDQWYRKDGYRSRDIHPLEIDVVLLAILRTVGDLARTRGSVESHLESVLGIYRNQIVVDEATDFSPIQLACMSALAHPRIRSFFACGDFNQRLTTWGTRLADDLKWACPGLEIKEINVSYRQTKQLNELTCAIMQAAGTGSTPHQSAERRG